MNINEKLLIIQTELKAPKGQYNSFGKYSYRSCEDIQEALKPFLKQLNVVLVIRDKMIQLGDRYYVEAIASIYDCESEGEISNTAYAREELDKKGMDASQITGSASSYARKYALNGLFCIDDVKDSDSDKPKDDKPKENKKPSESENKQDAFSKHDELVGIFHQEIVRTGKSLKYFLTLSKVSDAKYIKTADLNNYIDGLKELPTKEVAQ